MMNGTIHTTGGGQGGSVIDSIKFGVIRFDDVKLKINDACTKYIIFVTSLHRHSRIKPFTWTIGKPITEVDVRGWL